MENGKKSYLLIDNKKEAYFTILGAGLIAIFSLGLLLPITYWIKNRYIIARRYIDDRQLTFKGKLWVYFLIFYIGLTLALSCVLLIQLLLEHYHLRNSIPHQLLNAIPGAFSVIFINIWINKYTIISTHIMDSQNNKSGVNFKIWLFLGKFILTKIINVTSIWLLYPLSTRLSSLYDYRRCYLDGYYFSYHFSFKKMYPRWLLDALLSLLSLGLYFPMALIRRYSVDQELVHILAEDK